MFRKQRKEEKKKRSAADLSLGFLMSIVLVLLLLTLGELVSGDGHVFWLLGVYGVLLLNLIGLKQLLKKD